MRDLHTLLGALAMLPAANCIAFGGPAPTETAPIRVQEGWTPKPTKGPSVAELKNRQTNLDPETCGWIDGDFSNPISCPIGTCMLYTASGIGMAGCCESDTQDCGWAKSCVDYDSYWSSTVCGDDCVSDTFIRKCSNTYSPYCVTWTYANDDVWDYGCADTSQFEAETIYQEATDSDFSFSTSMTLETLSGNDVTGWDGSSTSSDDSTSTATESDTASSAGTAVTDEDGPTPTGDSTQATDAASTSGATSSPKNKTTSIGVIIGAAIGGLVVLAIAGGLVIFFCLKARKRKQLAASQTGGVQAPYNPAQDQPAYNPNQSVYGQSSQMQQQPQHQAFVPQTPQQPGPGGFFQPGSDQKFNPQTQGHEYPASPMSVPGTPAPPYVQPYYAPPNSMSSPPMPQTPHQYQTTLPAPGTYEVDAISSAQTPSAPGRQPHPQPQTRTYEIGQGK
ncbi:hypothetical protein K491DRAFT_705825 [Lophiostoma macrostomum CBS 122681]|uniref:Mid2 domain-containing protein n=1 Tax=Lophiostoma macrostomum CBS 122681 TaxID=1314788 RepID=A0A6A6T4G0_9PLEO|nr:hypothetical protein K491DRAFT_705825 [Lophiostoma macrostomum CBS 122681]